MQHDVENYLGVVALREKENVTEFGYKHWWLTLDRIAWQIKNTIREEVLNGKMFKDGVQDRKRPGNI